MDSQKEINLQSQDDLPPKRPQNAYFRFRSDPKISDEMKEKYEKQGASGSYAKFVAKLWKQLNEEDKKFYEDAYHNERIVYEEKLKSFLEKHPDYQASQSVKYSMTTTPRKTAQPTPRKTELPTLMKTGQPTPIKIEQPTLLKTEAISAIKTGKPTPMKIEQPTPLKTEANSAMKTGLPTPMKQMTSSKKKLVISSDEEDYKKPAEDLLKSDMKNNHSSPSKPDKSQLKKAIPKVDSLQTSVQQTPKSNMKYK